MGEGDDAHRGTQYAILLIRDVTMDNDEYAAYATRFGALCEVLPVHRRTGGHSFIEALNITDSDDNTGWHTDHVEVAGQSPLITFLCDEAPAEEGETLFCDMRRVIDRMPADLRAKLEEHEGYYPIRDSIYSRLEAGQRARKRWSEAELARRTAHLRNYTMPLVQRHSISGHRTLVLNTLREIPRRTAAVWRPGTVGQRRGRTAQPRADGDGGPRPLHVYRQGGSYRVTLVVTDDEGCSTTFVWTGRNALCTGSPAGRATRTVTIQH